MSKYIIVVIYPVLIITFFPLDRLNEFVHTCNEPSTLLFSETSAKSSSILNSMVFASLKCPKVSNKVPSGTSIVYFPGSKLFVV